MPPFAATRILALAGAALLLSAPAAMAGETGGAAPPQPVPATQAGGAGFGAFRTDAHPVAHLTVAGSATRPTIRVRFTENAVKSVVADVEVLRVPGRKVAARINLGKVPTGRTISVRWPARVTLGTGRYLVRAEAHDAAGHDVLRVSSSPGRAFLVVRPRVVPKPKPKPKPAPAPAPAPAPTPTGHGEFPVRGPHSFGDPFGAARTGYSHQGQDILAAEGTPIVAPLGGTISTTGYQASAAGYYVVLNASDGHAYFFAHCQAGSTAVRSGQSVSTGSAICRLGHTGDATGPHLHFEEWVGGWRVNASSHPVNPMPQLRAWGG